MKLNEAFARKAYRPRPIRGITIDSDIVSKFIQKHLVLDKVQADPLGFEKAMSSFFSELLRYDILEDDSVANMLWEDPGALAAYMDIED